MISYIRNNRYLQLFWGAMALFLLNLSVDAPDMSPTHLPEDLTYNEQESIVELIVEQLLGFEDAFDEFDDDDSEERTSKPTLKLVLHPPTAPSPNQLHAVVSEHQSSPYPPYPNWLSGSHGKVPAPPPKV